MFRKIFRPKTHEGSFINAIGCRGIKQRRGNNVMILPGRTRGASQHNSTQRTFTKHNVFC